MKLPEKVNIPLSLNAIEIAIERLNDIIDYLAEREGQGEPRDYDTPANGVFNTPTPLFKAEDIQLLNVGSKYGLVVSSLTKTQAEQAKEALLKQTI